MFLTINGDTITHYSGPEWFISWTIPGQSVNLFCCGLLILPFPFHTSFYLPLIREKIAHLFNLFRELRSCCAMPAELGRIDLGDVTPHNIKLLRKVNTVVFPVSYHDKFYKVATLLTCIVCLCLSRYSPHRMCLRPGSWQSWLTSMTLWWGLSAAGSTYRVLAERFGFY